MDKKLIEMRATLVQSGTTAHGQVAQMAPKPLRFLPSMISPMPHPLVGWQWHRE